MTDDEINSGLRFLVERRRLADEIARSVDASKTLSEEEKAEFNHECMIAYVGADIRMRRLLDQWCGDGREEH